MTSDLAYKQRGRGEPVVFLHGLGGSSESWNPQLLSLGERFHCIAPDLPGYGASPLSHPMSFAAWSDALAAMLDDLKLERVSLVGHSLGGMLAQEMTARHPDRVAKLVLSCTSPAFGGKDGDFQKQFLSGRLSALESGGTMKDVAAEAVPGLFGPSAPRATVEAATATMAQVPETTYRAALDCLVAFDRRGALGTISVPTLLLAAEHDRAAPPPVMTRMGEKIRGARVVCLSGVGHLPNLEAPERFDREVADFLRAAV